MSRVSKCWSGLVGDFVFGRHGGISALIAILLPLILGSVTFGLDHMRATQQIAAMQRVADAAALATARQSAFLGLKNKNSKSKNSRNKSSNHNDTLNAIADGIVQNSLRDDFPTTTTATKILEEGKIEVALTARYGSIFGELGFFGDNPFTVTSIAQSFGGQNVCFIALGSDEDDSAIAMHDSSKLHGGSCEVYSSSTRTDSISMEGSAHIEASLICSAGGYEGSAGNFSQFPATDCTQIEDPLRDSPPPPMNSTCDHKDYTLDGGTHTLNPGVYCGKTDLRNGADVWMSPGIYIFRDGELHVHDTSRLTGQEVGLYFDDDKAFFQFLDEGEVDLSAPSSGPMAGILMAARPICEGDDATLSVSIGATTPCQSKRQFLITSSNVRSLLGTIHLPSDELYIDTTMPISEEAAFTIIVVGRMELKDSPAVVLNTDYGLTTVPVPDGFQSTPGVSRLIR